MNLESTKISGLTVLIRGFCSIRVSKTVLMPSRLGYCFTSSPTAFMALLSGETAITINPGPDVVDFCARAFTPRIATITTTLITILQGCFIARAFLAPRLCRLESDLGKRRKMKLLVRVARQYRKLVNRVFVFVSRMGIDSIQRNNDLIAIDAAGGGAGVENRHIGKRAYHH